MSRANSPVPEVFQHLQSLRPKACTAQSSDVWLEGSYHGDRFSRLNAELSAQLRRIEDMKNQPTSITAKKARLEAYRQAFAGFLEHAGPYQQVLGKVKAAYEVALTDWIASAADNVHLRQLLAKEERAEAGLMAAARAEGAQQAAAMHAELTEQRDAVMQQATEAEESCGAWEAQLADLQLDIAAHETQLHVVGAANRAALQQLSEAGLSSSMCVGVGGMRVREQQDNSTGGFWETVEAREQLERLGVNHSS